MDYARQVKDGKIDDSRLFFFHRQASDEHDLSTAAGVRDAVIEASGPAVAWSDIDGICGQWDDPTADKTYLERVWLNRLVRASERAFDVERWRGLADPGHVVPPKAKITLGFDGARWRDATALVGTEILTGFQWLVAIWERPQNVETWEVAVGQVDAAIRAAFETWDVWRLYADPPYWESLVAEWAGRYGEQRVVEWWTNRWKQMAYAIRAFNNAIVSGELSHDGNKHLTRHIGNAVRHELSLHDDQGLPMWTIYKEQAESPHKIDGAMAAILAWEARTDAIAAGVGQKKQSVYETRGLEVA
jgi:phage terminase large subunit-like protein